MSVVISSLGIETSNIVNLNANILTKTCEYFDLPLNLEIFSDMNLAVGEVNHPGEWALKISKAINATQYINPIGGIEIFNPTQFDLAGISLKFLANNLKMYSQRRSVFEPSLSIIDVMMFNDKDNIRELICDFEYISGS